MTAKPWGTNGTSGYPGDRKACFRLAIGYAQACGIAVPAEPKPIPAIEAASIMFSRAFTSSPSATARLRYSPPYSRALAAQISDIGLDPWKGGRSSGVAGAGREL